MTEPVPGHPEDVRAAADALAGAAGRFRDLHAAVLGRATTLGDAWTGAAGQFGLARIRHDADAIERAAAACTAAVEPLRTFADQLTRAQQDWGDGSAMATQVLTEQAVTDGVAVMDSATDRAQQANEDAARALDAASAQLLDLIPPPTTPQVVGGGTVGDGLWKAGEDAAAGFGALLGGTLDRLNPFSDRFGPAWAETWAQFNTPLGDPWDTLTSTANTIAEPVRESQRDGGTAEAVGRAAGVAASMAGDKGVGALSKSGELGTVKKLDEAEVGPHTPIAPGGGLQWHEDRGGHALRPDKAHVGATDLDMLYRQRSTPYPIKVSSFTNRESAERAVSENIAANKQAITNWLNSNINKRGFNFVHDFTVGRTAPVDANPGQIVDTNQSRVVLIKDPTVPEGYHILTAHPDT